MEINKEDVRRKVLAQINRGVIIRPEKCSNCLKSGMIVAHHHDYKKPYSIIWLCSKCHGFIHRKYNVLKNVSVPVDYSDVVDKYKDVKKNDIPGQGGIYIIRADEDTHTELKVMAAIKSVTIGTVLKQLVDAEKERNESEKEER